jgi:hypothetical protein
MGQGHICDSYLHGDRIVQAGKGHVTDEMEMVSILIYLVCRRDPRRGESVHADADADADEMIAFLRLPLQIKVDASCMHGS